MAKTKEERKEYNKRWAKRYYALPENRDKRKVASQKFRRENPEYFKQERVREGARKAAIEWYHKNTEKSKSNTRRRKLEKEFGITIQKYDEMFSSQKGLCAICLRTDRRRLAVDHNHSTGRVRDLLCAKCNTAIGLFDENPVILEAVIAYLKRHES
jgi:hypothetical protein